MADEDIFPYLAPPVTVRLLAAAVYYSEEVLRAQDGKVVPLKDKPNGNVIGTATLRYDEMSTSLEAKFNIDDPKMAEFLKSPSISINKSP